MADYKQNPHGDGWLVRYDDGTSEVVTTEGEAETKIAQAKLEANKVAKKQGFANQVLELVTKLSEIDDLREVYFDREYNSGGANEITDDDLSDLGITASEFTEGLTLIENLRKLLNNQAPTTGDYTVTISKLRTDI